MKELKLLTDQAIYEDSKHTNEKEDGLGFSAYAKVLGDAAIGTDGPFTIGIFGEWGTGKTSLMRTINAYLEKNLPSEFYDDKKSDSNIVTVWFNAWRYEKEEHPIVPLIATIIHALEKKQLSKSKNFLDSFIRALRAIAYGFSARSKVKVPGFAEVEASFIAKDMIERDKVMGLDPLLDRSIYYNAFERLSGLEKDTMVKIVVFIDDLDRCFPDQAIKLLESIKLVLCQPGFIFVLGVARSVIEGYLQHKYEKEYGLNEFKGELYLDKIVQLPFYIPSHENRMKNFVEILFIRFDIDRKIFEPIIDIIGIACKNNPRTSIRFINNLLIDQAINKILAKTEQIEEIPIGYFAITRSLQQNWREIYSELIKNNELCSTTFVWSKEGIPSLDSFGKGKEKEARIARILISDEYLLKLLFSEYGKVWLQKTLFRNAAIEFLHTQRSDIAIDNVMQEEITFDALVVYDSQDRNSVAPIVDRFKQRGLRIWIDTEQISPGMSSVRAFQQAAYNSKSIIVFISSEVELQTEITKAALQGDIISLLHQLIEDNIPIIPVLLPNTEEIPERWSFLEEFKIVKFREINGGGLNPLMDDRRIPKRLNIRRFHERPMLRQRI